jgi:NAD(P)-dependent dehydrogenase (short-subunit alcohol dehydrogenase family)
VTVFIAGGTKGLGLEIARHFVRAGTQRIGLIARDVARGEGAAEEIRSLASGIWALFAPADVTNAADVKRATAELAAALGDADIVINCTTGAFTGPASGGPDRAEPPTPAQGQTDGTVNLCRAVIDAMRRQGSGVFINVAADAAEQPPPGVVAVGQPMAAATAYCQALAAEVEARGIRVHTVTPSLDADGERTDLAGVADLVLRLASNGSPHGHGSGRTVEANVR